jgi:hypothetical protein
MITDFVAHITGNPNIPGLGSVNVRAQPGTAPGVAVLFQANIGTPNLGVLEVQPDQANNHFNGKVYHWFRLQFPNGEVGWVRDDLLSVKGDGTTFGYPKLTQDAYGFGILRQMLPTGVTTPPPPPPPPPPQEVIGTVISRSGLNLRDAPVNGNIKGRLVYGEKVKILSAQPQVGTAYKWAQVEAAAGRGWARTDYLSLSGDGSRFGLSKGDEYPAPMPGYWWVRGQNDVQANGTIDKHNGWDFGANPGQIIRCGPQGGQVVRLYNCTRCTPTKPNVLSQGLPLNSPVVLNDAAWGYGYGNAVLVRYTNNLLPASTRSRLVAQGLPGGHLFAIYAHMSMITVQLNQPLGANAQIGVIGNTGNSTATHLHLEVRASADPNDTMWGTMRIFDPEILFLR